MIGGGRIRNTGILPVGPAGVSPAESFDPELRRMGLTGLEPVTLRLSSACSNQLSYRPVRGLAADFRISTADFRFVSWRASRAII
jgi:hypothetical protein